MQKIAIKFPRQSGNDFYNTVRQRVHEYFQKGEISKYANTEMVMKTIFMLSLYFIPYLFVLFLGGVSTWLYLLLWVIMGTGMAGIGLSIMHDANHGAYSQNRKVNDFISKVIWFVGGSYTNWRIQHNVLHHSFTNINEHDEDLETVPFLRFSPHKKRMKIHRLQYIYAWFFYGLMTLMWATTKDFKQLIRYKNNNLLKSEKRPYKSLMRELIVVKAIYYILFLVLPLILSNQSWWVVVLGFVVMHFVAGFILASIFQPAHVMPETDFPEPKEDGSMENQWAEHQLRTTVNFAPKSKLFSWYVGGLNFQIEHHLFPNICHVHYKKISGIVQKTAKEFNLPYYSKRTFFAALWAHKNFLKQLGKA
ncbi:MAG: acyl-CoA desaturase [Flavobacteriales bacterium]|nr:acyl-CoA desaturase [Flavobacteriales bacterium]